MYGWNILTLLLIFEVFFECYTLKLKNSINLAKDIRVSAAKWETLGDTLTITCSVETYNDEIAGNFNMYLLCPLNQDDSISKFCYVNCSPQCFSEFGLCDTNTFEKSFVQCSKVQHSQNRVDYHYKLNGNFISKGGYWFCQYKSLSSQRIFIKKNIVTTTTKLSQKITTKQYNISKIRNYNDNNQIGKIHFQTSNVISSAKSFIVNNWHWILALIISVAINIIFIGIICHYKTKLINRPKMPPPIPPYPNHLRYGNSSHNDPTETISMQTNQYIKGKSECSQTSSLEQTNLDSNSYYDMRDPDNGLIFRVVKVTNSQLFKHPSSTSNFPHLKCSSPHSVSSPFNSTTGQQNIKLQHHPLTKLPYNSAQNISFPNIQHHQSINNFSQECNTPEQQISFNTDSNTESGIGSEQIALTNWMNQSADNHLLDNQRQCYFFNKTINMNNLVKRISLSDD